MPRTVYRVLPDGNEWIVRRDGADRADSRHPTKEPAVNRARALCLNNMPSQLVVHRRDGTIEYEYTYGNDPYPPRG